MFIYLKIWKFSLIKNGLVEMKIFFVSKWKFFPVYNFFFILFERFVDWQLVSAQTTSVDPYNNVIAYQSKTSFLCLRHRHQSKMNMDLLNLSLIWNVCFQMIQMKNPDKVILSSFCTIVDGVSYKKSFKWYIQIRPF